jgi:hypothetical protein
MQTFCPITYLVVNLDVRIPEDVTAVSKHVVEIKD